MRRCCRAASRFSGTALSPASEHGHTSTVQILINAGVPLDHVNRLGWTALLEAIVLGDGSADQVDTVARLVGAGAEVGIRDGQGRRPRSLAAARGFDAIVGVIDDAAGIRERGKQLVTASRAGDTERVERLLDRHASVAVRDRTGATALVAAAYGNHRAGGAAAPRGRRGRERQGRDHAERVPDRHQRGRRRPAAPAADAGARGGRPEPRQLEGDRAHPGR